MTRPEAGPERELAPHACDSGALERRLGHQWRGRRRGRHVRGRLPVELHAHRPCQRAAERVLAGLAACEAHRQRAAERLALAHLQPFARGDASLGQVSEHLRVGVRDAHEQALVALLQAVERDGLALAQLELRAGDRVAVGVERGVAELGRDQPLELL